MAVAAPARAASARFLSLSSNASRTLAAGLAVDESSKAATTPSMTDGGHGLGGDGSGVKARSRRRSAWRELPDAKRHSAEWYISEGVGRRAAAVATLSGLFCGGDGDCWCTGRRHWVKL